MLRQPPHRSYSFERIENPKAVQVSRVLQILGIQDTASTLFSAANYQGIPEGKPVQTMKINGAEYVSEFGDDHIQFGKYLDFTARLGSFNVQFSGRSYEVLLQHLARDHTTSLSEMLREQVKRTLLLGWRGRVVCIDQDVRIEEATNVHESRRD